MGMAIPAGVTKWKKIFLPNISSTFSKFSKPINIRNSFLPQQRQLSLFSPKLCQESEQQNQVPYNHPEENDETIYEGILATQIKLVKGFSLTTSFIGISCQPILLMHMQQDHSNLALMSGVGAFLSFFTFATPLLIHTISKKEIKFKLQDVYVPDIPGMFTTFKANGKPLFVDGGEFYEPAHFGKIMGYDKPLNLRWDKERNVSESVAQAMKKSEK